MLYEFRYRRNFHGEDGKAGQGSNKSGHAGKNGIVNVPPGTLVLKVNENGIREVLGDLVGEGTELLVAKGGKGGRGNTSFARAQNQTPLLAEDGELTEEVTLELELQLLADVAIVGLPNVGKSSLLRTSSRARPNVASYPFTTLEPVLGVVQRKRQEFILVEIPGLIEGAHRGVGLGHEFLRHMKRTRGIIHLLDGTSEHILQDYLQVRQEMGLYDEGLLSKPEIVVVNKIDVPEVQAKRAELEVTLQESGINSHFISAVTEEGVGEVLDKALQMLATAPYVETIHPPVIPIVRPKERGDGVSIEKDGEVFVVKSPRAERIVRRVDLEDWAVQAQLWAELQRMGIARALDRAGAKEGSVVRIGDWELEWK